jgi:methylmalonyl-CoA mutase C-terminal domain/subunit
VPSGTGLHQTPEMIAEAAIQEDVDVVGLSILSGAHMVLLPKIVDLLKEKGAGDRLIVAGGIIPQDDIDELRKAGIAQIFGPGTTTTEIVDYVRKEVASRMK